MLTNKRGEILAVTMGLSIVFILLGYYAIYFATVKRETFEKENMRTRAFWLAEAGRTAAQAELIYLLQTNGILQNNGVPTVDLDKYVSTGDPLGLLTEHCGFSLKPVDMDNNSATPLVTAATYTYNPSVALNVGGSPATYSATAAIAPTPGVTPNPSFDGTFYTFHYQYRIDSQGSVAGNPGFDKMVRIEGKPYQATQIPTNPATYDHFIVKLRPGFSYAYYNYFASSQSADHWLVEGQNFNGPVHTNLGFGFANNPDPSGFGSDPVHPGPHFAKEVTQWFSKAGFYNWDPKRGAPAGASLDADKNDKSTYPLCITPDIPNFQGGFTRGVTQIGMAFDQPADTWLFRNTSNRTSAQTKEMQTMKDDALAGMSEPGSPGVYLSLNANNEVKGGVFISTSASIKMNKDSNQNPTYEITTDSGCTRKVTVNYNTKKTTIDDIGGACSGNDTPAKTYTGIPDGKSHEGIIIYDTGKISGLSGVVQKDTAATVVAEGPIHIREDITYEDDPRIIKNAKNVLGVVSWNAGENGEGITIDYNWQHPNVRIDGILMAPGGTVYAQQYTDRKLGVNDIIIFGGIIQERSGPFGYFVVDARAYYNLFSGNPIYDERMANGMAPPYFPNAIALQVVPTGLDTKPKWSGE